MIDDDTGALTLMGSTGNPDDVVVQGGGSLVFRVILRNDVTVESLSLTAGGDGIYVQGAADLTLRNVKSFGNFDGLQVFSARDVLIEGGSFSGNTNNMLIENFRHLTINNATVDNSTGTDGAKIQRGTSVTIDGGSYSGNRGDGLEIRTISGPIAISNETADENGRRGLLIVSSSPMEVSDSEFRRNNFGGVSIFTVSADPITLTRVTAAENIGQASGAGISIVSASFRTAQIQIIESTIANNSNQVAGSAFGGGLLVQNGQLIVRRSTISGNEGGRSGGGVYLISADATFFNSTISGNTSVGRGGGIGLRNGDRDLHLINTTITDNQASIGGGVGVLTGTVRALNTIIAGNTGTTSDPDFRGTVDSWGGNLVGDGTGSSGFTAIDDQVGTAASPIDPLLGALQNNGGLTETHEPLAGSPAIDTGNAVGAPTVDQRGVARPQGAGVDIGAVEIGNTNRPPTADSGGPYSVDEGASTVLDGSNSSDPDQTTATLTFEWDLDGDGTFGETGTDAGRGDEVGVAPTFSAAGLDGAVGSVFTVSLRVTDDQGASDEASVGIGIQNVAPAVGNAGDVVVDEGQTANNSGTWSDPGLDVVTLTASEGTVTKNANGTWSWSFNTNDGPDQSQTVTITATDSDGAATETTFDLTVNNVAPVITRLASSHETVENKSADGAATIDGAFADVQADVHVVTVDWGDGTAVESLSAADVDQVLDEFSASHNYATGGIFTITVTVTVTVIDDDSAEDSRTTTAVVTGVGVVGDVLYVIGTAQSDHVSIHRQGNDRLKIHADFLAEGNSTTVASSAVSKIVAYLCDGDDRLTIAGNVDKPAIVHGGDGDDHLKAGGGPTALLGDRGSDTLIGGSGRDILIGGSGQDRLVGGGGEDILIGGVLIESDDDSLMTAMSAWGNDDDDYDTRVAAIDALFTVVDDGDSDRLTGGTGLDLFFDGLGDVLTDGKTKKNAETVL